jgi:hypothetical protein
MLHKQQQDEEDSSMRLVTKQVVLEGCDLSGKTTFYRDFHKATDFRYDIRDRGHLSRAVYPKIFGRDDSHEKGDLNRFLDDLNNVVVLLAPGWNTVTARFASRGDEMHNLDTLRRTWEEFNSHAMALRDHPSVIVCRELPDPEAVRDVIISREAVTTKRIAEYAEMSLSTTGRNESIDTQFEVILSPVDDPGPDSLRVSGEEEYYSSIESDLMNRIVNEMASGQSAASRRFVTANSSCISYVRFIHRDEQDVLDVVCRSTNIPKNLKIDLDALVHLGFKTQILAGLKNRNIKMRVKLNCAHIVP